jgi:DegV family protein with EDD domain
MPPAPAPWALPFMPKTSMSEKVAIVVDSIACLTREQVKQHKISIAPLPISAGGKIYRDWVDITPTEAYKLFLKDPDSFHAAGASPGSFIDAYREASKRAKNILCITVSGGISGANEAARKAKEYIRKEHPHLSIEILDSQMATAAEGFIALAAAQAAEEGKSLAEVVKVAKEMKGKAAWVVALDTIKHVYRSGRIPKIAARMGSLLNIRPILTMSPATSGLIRFVGAARNKEGGIERMLKIMKSKVGQKPVHVAVMHAYALADARKLKERVAAEFNCAELWLTEFSPLMGYACGTGALGLAFYKED